MPRARQKPSIRDVAALAGVSYQTVSRVLNDPGRVRPDTAQRVHEAIRALRYRPSGAARSLARNRSNTIGVIAVHGGLFGPAQTTLAIDEGARARGYASAVVTVRDDSAASLGAAREQLLTLGVDAVVLMAWSEPVLELTQRFARDLPTCVITEGEVPDGVARATGSHRLGGELATRALLDEGRTRIGHLSGPSDWLEAVARRDGWRSASGDVAGPVVEGDWSPASGHAGVDGLLAAEPGLDAIFAANDQMAIGALRRLGELGLDVPGRIALVGYDDIEVGAYLGVPLATVRQPFAEVGAAAVDLVFDLMAGAEAGERVVEPRLVRRESLGRPRH